MNSTDAAALAALCRAARHRVIAADDAAIAAFVAGVLARGPIERAALVDVLERAGIPAARWHAAAEALAPRTRLVAQVPRSSWLRRLLAGSEP